MIKRSYYTFPILLKNHEILLKFLYKKQINLLIIHFKEKL